MKNHVKLLKLLESNMKHSPVQDRGIKLPFIIFSTKDSNQHIEVNFDDDCRQ